MIFLYDFLICPLVSRLLHNPPIRLPKEEGHLQRVLFRGVLVHWLSSNNPILTIFVPYYCPILTLFLPYSCPIITLFLPYYCPILTLTNDTLSQLSLLLP